MTTGFAFVASPKGRRGGDGEPNERRRFVAEAAWALRTAAAGGVVGEPTDSNPSLMRPGSSFSWPCLPASRSSVGVTWVSVWRWLKRMLSIVPTAARAGVAAPGCRDPVGELWQRLAP